ncbi:MAG: hypothetical protein AYK19_21895 [Theionarchaea archaeon DG-70-1]|nr:MAG: hypothetical protein AYK19_21895 [Theionarchaea archaeon DG-70-1]
MQPRLLIEDQKSYNLKDCWTLQTPELYRWLVWFYTSAPSAPLWGAVPVCARVGAFTLKMIT